MRKRLTVAFFQISNRKYLKKNFEIRKKLIFAQKIFFENFFEALPVGNLEKGRRESLPNFLLFQVQKELERYLQYPCRKKIAIEIGRVKKKTTYVTSLISYKQNLSQKID